MSQFDLAEFEARLHDLLADRRRLRAECAELRAAHEAEQRRNSDIRKRLNGVIERIRALEAEADHAQHTDDESHGQ